MEKELELRINEQPYTENTGTLATDIGEAADELTIEEKNTQLGRLQNQLEL